jgi:hypothetical protein
MSKLNNLALTLNNLALILYNKNRHQLMKLYNNKRTSQLKKDIIKEIFNQEGGKPFLMKINNEDNEDKIRFSKDTTNENLNEVKYISYIITTDEHIIPYNKFSKIKKELYSDELINIEDSFLNIFKNESESEFNKLIKNNEDNEDKEDNEDNEDNEIIIKLLIRFKELNQELNQESINIDFIITLGIIYFDDILYIVGFRTFFYNNENFFDKKLNINFIYEENKMYIVPYFRGLNISKYLFYNNITIFINDIYKDSKFFYIYISDYYKDKNKTFLCHDRIFRKNGFKYRLTIDIYNLETKEIEEENNYLFYKDNYFEDFEDFEDFDEPKNEPEDEFTFINKEPYKTVLYFRDLYDLLETSLSNYILLKLDLDRKLYELYNNWYDLLYNEILTYKDWYERFNVNIDNTIHEMKFSDYLISNKIYSFDIKIIIKSIIIPTDIYENKYNNIYFLIDKVN